LIKVTVPALPVRNMKGIGKTSLKPYDFNIQTIYCHTADQLGNALPFPEKSELMLDSDQAPFPPGEYTLLPNSLYVDRQGRLAVAPKLTKFVPVKA
jgi:hypothetical protein